MVSNPSKHVHIIFPLERDTEEYPPVESERLWAVKTNEGYEIDNIPFFVRGISSGDIVTVEEKNGSLYFKELVKMSSNSTLRVVAFGDTDKSKQEAVRGLRRELKKIGCESEVSHIPNLISVEVSSGTPLVEVLNYLKNGENEGRWEYEEAALRQPTTISKPK